MPGIRLLRKRLLIRRTPLRVARKAVAEAIGTFTIVFAGCGAIMVANRFSGAVSPSVIPIVFGLAVAAMIHAVGHISGAHFNPAVTLAFAVARHFPMKEIPLYWGAQFLGAGAATLLLHLLLPPGASYGATVPAVSVPQAFLWEVVLTFFLMFVIIAVATDTRAVDTMAGAAIGATVMLDAFVGGPVTGASMNPARSLAPAIAEGRFSDLWVYFLGPFLGALLAALTYQWARCESSAELETVSSENRKNAKGCC